MLIHREEHMGYGKVAFVCGTPLQIIGAMSIATELEKDGAVCDAFLRHDFSGSSDRRSDCETTGRSRRYSTSAMRRMGCGAYVENPMQSISSLHTMP